MGDIIYPGDNEAPEVTEEEAEQILRDSRVTPEGSLDALINTVPNRKAVNGKLEKLNEDLHENRFRIKREQQARSDRSKHHAKTCGEGTFLHMTRGSRHPLLLAARDKKRAPWWTFIGEFETRDE